MSPIDNFCHEGSACHTRCVEVQADIVSRIFTRSKGSTIISHVLQRTCDRRCADNDVLLKVRGTLTKEINAVFHICIGCYR